MVVSVEVRLLKTGIQKTEQDILLAGLKDLYMTSLDLTYFSHYLFKQNRQFSGFSEQAIWVGVFALEWVLVHLGPIAASVLLCKGS